MTEATTVTKQFRDRLREKVFSNLPNHFTDNADRYRLAKRAALAGIKDTIRTSARGVLRKVGRYSSSFFEDVVGHLDEVSDAFSFLYSILEDEQSKELLLDIGAYRVLGNTRVKLPLSSPAYWEGIKKVETLADTTDVIDPGFEIFRLYKHRLNEVGYPIELYFNSQGIYTDFILKQYEYQGKSIHVKAQPGDYVIDGGGCWGDTALYFADKAGEQGKVFTFEFIPGNLNILGKNLALNPELEPRIQVVENALDSGSGQDIFYIDNGPASKVFFDEADAYTGKTKTLSIDGLVERDGLEKINFIKLDIEGAELSALKGAEKTIKRFKPVLAVALYHDLDDFFTIPQFLHGMGLGYKFYLGHYTIHHEETILFAVAD